MRWLNWRRAIALVAIIVGLGAGATVPAAAAVPSSSSNFVTPNDFWWPT